MSDNPIFDVPMLSGTETGATEAFSTPVARRLGASVLLLVVATDVLFYKQRPGLSIAVFGVIALAILRWNQPQFRWDRHRVVGLALIALALAQSAIETGFANAVTLFALFSFAMIDIQTKPLGARFAAPLLAADCWLRAPARWLSLPAALHAAVGGDSRDTLAVRTARRLGLVVPAVALLIPFALLLGTGNTLLGEAFSRLGAWLRSIHLPELPRIIFWAVAATGAMTFLAPRVRTRVGAWLDFPRLAAATPAADPHAALWRTWLMLAAVNALFCWANTVDAIFLWIHAALPVGISYSQFVHHGVYSLIAATVLAGVVLAVLFEQDQRVAGHSATRALALAWIAQNLVLLASVAVRLKLYVEAYNLTVPRLGVASFLVLVAAGFGLLAWRILAPKSLRWLILANAFAVVALFYVAQFVDFAGITARYNTRRWLEHRSPQIDVAYLQRLGPPAWPSLRRLERGAPDVQTRIDAAQALARSKARADRASGWGSLQWREARLRKEVFSK